MGYQKDNFKRIREEYATKALEAQNAADARRAELYAAIPAVRELDERLSAFGLRILHAAIRGGDTDGAIAELQTENERILAARGELLRANGYPADYTEPRYACDRCKDSGYVGIQMCACMRRRLIEAGMESSGLATLMRTQSFENFSLDYYRARLDEYKRMQLNVQYIRSYAEKFAMGKDAPTPDSLLFMGGTGLGKTHLSTAVAKEVIERGYDVFYNSAVGMLSDFEFRRFGSSVASSDGDNTERYTECDLLIIDDLATEVVNQFTLSCLYHVVNTRLNRHLPTIISTNLSIEDLRKSYGDRLASRMTGEYIVLPFYGSDIRKQKLQTR